MTTATHTQTKNSTATATAAAAAATASAETVQNAFNETMKTSMGAAMKAMQTGLDAWTNGARTMFDGFAAATKSVAAMPMPAMPFAMPNGSAGAQAAFEQMTQAMHGVVDANARFATECTALAVDAVRANARAVERMGEALIQMPSGCTAAQGTAKQSTATPNASIDAVRAIVDDAATFARTAGERLVAMQGEHAKSIAGIVERSVRGTTCCNGSARA